MLGSNPINYLFFPEEAVQKYRYNLLTQPLIEDIKVLQSLAFKVNFKENIHNYKDKFPMVSG